MTWVLASLRDRIAKQNQAMDEVRASQKTLEEENERIRQQYEERKAQNKALKEETETLKKNVSDLRTTLNSRGCKHSIWASLAARSNGQPLVSPQRASHVPESQSTPHNLPGIYLDSTALVNPQFGSSDVKTVREQIRQALYSHPGTKGVGWTGVARRRSDYSKTRICLRTQEDAALARNHDGWLQSHFRGAPMEGEQWYPVKGDRVNKNSICDESLIRLREDACVKLGTEKSILIRKMRFIARPNPDKLYCSVVLYLASRPEAERLLNRKYIDVDGEVAYTRVFGPSVGPRRCFQSHQFDKHEARRCPAQDTTR